jgi:transposase InsO family protein
MDAAAGSSAIKCTMVLKTVDQYDIWKGRVSDACWSATLKNLFEISDDDCKAAIRKLEEKDPKEKHLYDWVGKCWNIITSSIHDEVYRRVNHVPRGLIQSLLTEISHALVVNNLEEVSPLRLELYGGSMQKDCGCDLQLWINFIVERAEKLSFLKKPVEEAELITLFLKGLHPVFNQLQVYFAIPGSLPKTFAGAVSITRKFASNPTVAAELAKLRSSGLSQNMFPLQAQGVHTPSPSKSKQLCKLFASSGTCRYGARCKFVHTATPAASPAQSNQASSSNGAQRLKCSFCSKIGHSEEMCNTKLRLLEQVRQESTKNSAVLAAVSSSSEESKLESPEQPDDTTNQFYHFVFTVTTACDSDGWVLDSGATCCATNCDVDCVDIRECKVSVTAAGSNFTVDHIGTAVINTLDERGLNVQLRMQNTLISKRFPYKLLALQLFTSKGYQVVMGELNMRIVNPTSQSAFLGTKDTATQLFFLKCAPAPKVDSLVTSHTFLARSYGKGTTSDADQLWKLHLRHGHRNFVDIARQYQLPVPKEMPACTSCIMGKSHVQPHLSNGFERATRVAEGFHSDFRGPFSVPTPQGAEYLLTLIDDRSGRVFGFLTKSQSEWFGIWSKFVARIETEMGRPNCIAWILTDNGAVYNSGEMKTFCARKGIQQRFSAPYAQWMNHTAERNMRTIGEMGLTTIIHANLPKNTWGYAMLHAIEVLNRTCSPQQARWISVNLLASGKMEGQGAARPNQRSLSLWLPRVQARACQNSHKAR